MSDDVAPDDQSEVIFDRITDDIPQFRGPVIVINPGESRREIVSNVNLGAEIAFSLLFNGTIAAMKAGDAESEAGEGASSEVAPIVEDLGYEKLLEKYALGISAGLFGVELLAGSDPLEAAFTALEGYAAEQLGKATVISGAEILGYSGAILPVLEVVVGAAALYGGVKFAKALYNYTEESLKNLDGTIDPDNLSNVLTSFKDQLSSLTTQLVKQFSQPQYTLTTDAGFALISSAFRTYEANVESLTIASLNSAAQVFGLAPDDEAVTDSISGVQSGAASLNTLTNNALAATRSAIVSNPNISQGDYINDYINANNSSLPVDVQSAMQTSQAQQAGTGATLSDGMIVNASPPGTFTFTVNSPASAPDIASETQVDQASGALISSDIEYNNGASEYTLVDNGSGTVTITDYSGAHETGSITRVDIEYDDGTSEIATVDPATQIVTTNLYNQNNGQGTGTLLSTMYLVSETNSGVTQAAGTSTLTVNSQTYDSIASSLSLGNGGGAVLAAMNGMSSSLVMTNQPEVYVPQSAGDAQDFTQDTSDNPNGTAVYQGDNGDGTPGPSTVTEDWTFSGTSGNSAILDLADRTWTPLAIAGTDNPGGQLYIVNGQGQVIDILQSYDGGASLKQVETDTPADEQTNTPASRVTTLWVYPDGADGVAYTADSGGDFSGATTQEGLPFYSFTGGAQDSEQMSSSSQGVPVGPVSQYATTAYFNSTSDTPDASWSISVQQSQSGGDNGGDGSGDGGTNGDTSQTSAGSVIVTGLMGSGYDGTATIEFGREELTYGTVLGSGQGTVTETPLPDVSTVVLGGTTYDLGVVMDPADGSNQVQGFGSSSDADNFGGTIVAEGAGTHSLSFGGSDDIYWHVEGQNDTAELGDGNTEIYLGGAYSDYQFGYDGQGDLTLTGGSEGSLSLSIADGTGELNFTDGTIVGLGDMDDAVEYAGTYGDSFTLYGGIGRNTAYDSIVLIMHLNRIVVDGQRRLV